jgi:hypothetical protein
MASNTRDRVQFAVLPCRISESGQPQVLLLTSRETRRWVIPKGWPVKGLKPREVAAQDCWASSPVSMPSASTITRSSFRESSC